MHQGVKISVNNQYTMLCFLYKTSLELQEALSLLKGLTSTRPWTL